MTPRTRAEDVAVDIAASFTEYLSSAIRSDTPKLVTSEEVEITNAVVVEVWLLNRIGDALVLASARGVCKV